MSELLQGWKEERFGNVFDRFQYGLTAKAQAGRSGTRFLRITDLENYSIDWDTVPSCEGAEQELEKYRLRHGDFVFARSGSVEKACRIQQPPDAVFASYLIRARPKSLDSSDWLSWFIQSPQYLEQIREAAAGIGLQNVNAQKFAAVRVPIAPLPEQRRIVAKLDNLFAKSRRARQELTHLPRLVEHYKQAILAKAFSGDLTADWRAKNPESSMDLSLLRRSLKDLSGKMDVNPWKKRDYEEYPLLEIPDSWHQVRLLDVALHRSGIAYKSTDFRKEGFQVVRLGNLYQGKLDLTQL